MLPHNRVQLIILRRQPKELKPDRPAFIMGEVRFALRGEAWAIRDDCRLPTGTKLEFPLKPCLD